MYSWFYLLLINISPSNIWALESQLLQVRVVF